jgi:hypothetical protein
MTGDRRNAMAQNRLRRHPLPPCDLRERTRLSYPANATAIVLAFSFVVSTPAWANDTSDGVMLPGLRATPRGGVVAATAAVVLHAGTVDVTISGAVSGTQPPSLAIDMPRFDWQGEAEPYPDRHFPELAVAVDGAPAKIKGRFAAYFGTVDITDIVEKAGLDPFVIADTPPLVSPGPDGAAAFDRLKELGAVVKSGPELVGSHFLAWWQAERHVQIDLPRNPALTLTLSYRARPGYRLLQLNDGTANARLRPYCLDGRTLAALLGHRSDAGIIEYAVVAGIDGTPPKTLTVEIGEPGPSEGPRALAAFCGTDGKSVVVNGAGSASSPARADSKGVVYILSVPAVPK